MLRGTGSPGPSINLELPTVGPNPLLWFDCIEWGLTENVGERSEDRWNWRHRIQMSVFLGIIRLLQRLPSHNLTGSWRSTSCHEFRKCREAVSPQRTAADKAWNSARPISCQEKWGTEKACGWEVIGKVDVISTFVQAHRSSIGKAVIFESNYWSARPILILYNSS